MEKTLISLLKLIKRTGLLLTAQFLFINAYATQAHFNGIKGFKLNSCDNGQCVSLLADKAYIGRIIKDGYAFETVKFDLKMQNNEQISFESSDVYYDLITKRILFRDVKDMNFKQAIYDFNEGKLVQL
jgi:hypothetical protein